MLFVSSLPIWMVKANPPFKKLGGIDFLRAAAILRAESGQVWSGRYTSPFGKVPGINMKNKTKGQLEAQISEVVIKFEKEFMGRGPLETKAYLIDDMVLVRLRNVLTQAELKLASTPESRDGRDLVKRIRSTLLEQGRPLLEEALVKILGVRVKSLHTDISTVTGERVIIFSLEHHPEFLQKQ